MEAIATSQDQGAPDSVSSKTKYKNKLKGKRKVYRKGKGQVFLSKMLGPEGLESTLEFQISASSFLEEHA